MCRWGRTPSPRGRPAQRVRWSWSCPPPATTPACPPRCPAPSPRGAATPWSTSLSTRGAPSPAILGSDRWVSVSPSCCIAFVEWTQIWITPRSIRHHYICWPKLMKKGKLWYRYQYVLESRSRSLKLLQWVLKNEGTQKVWSKTSLNLDILRVKSKNITEVDFKFIYIQYK